MKTETRNEIKFMIIEIDVDIINDASDMLNLMVNAGYSGCDGIITFEEVLGEEFFDLKTGYAGEILQKFSNYKMKIGIVGDFSNIKSKSLSDFIFESNKGDNVCFLESLDACLNHLTK